MRIRSIKPEFFDSPSTAAAGPWARLFFIAMWCMADDWGVGDANPKTLAAGAFPNDDQWTGKEIPSLCKEVADAFGVMFYTNRGRRYYQVPSWEDHQVTQRRAKRRHPTFDDPESALDLGIHDLPSVDKEVPCEPQEDASTEQGNRGTGEQGNRGTSAILAADAAVAAPPPREDVEALCLLLADRIEQNGSKRPTIGKRWRDAARLMIDTDGRTPEQIAYLINWSQSDEFWKGNILSMPKLREKFDTLRMQSQRPTPGQQRRVGIASQVDALRFYEGGE